MTYKSKQILDADDLYDVQELDSIEYQPTKDELGWLDFVRGKYAIADYFDSVLTMWHEQPVLVIDPYMMSAAMNGDNGDCPFAPCLAEDTALAKLIFWTYSEDAEYDDYFEKD